MTKREDTLNKTYGNIPKEVGYSFDVMSALPTFRSLKYYWYRLVRSITR
jgi:hypothetical protein